MRQGEPDMRRTSLDASIAEYQSRGFQLESRTDTQAILVRRSRLERVARQNGSRIAIWVDEHGAVEAQPIEPRRW
jgi:hypothetical protein